MAEDVACFSLWNLAVIEVKVRTANSGRGDPQNDVVLILECWIGNGIHPDILGAVISQCSHRFNSCLEAGGGSLQWQNWATRLLHGQAVVSTRCKERALALSLGGCQSSAGLNGSKHVRLNPTESPIFIRR
ncbi:hypothetical protein WR25_00527 [Diploscapter pachys]|uniref:Uncharacterized protein n=1 Tax=Diploscapter pachys TaxID=2018661 RepID=A0A2A2KL55_9BILA|nr:hypothetical protein WR25_00527 [Diploscapter pachys]